MITGPDFATLSKIDEQSLTARLEAVRSSIAHAGEKGRALEHHVIRLLRDLLPSEYGLTTGFIAALPRIDAAPVLSSQLDVIIYDAVRCAPLVRLETCDVVPLEAVYAYVEVKASLRSSSNEAQHPADDSIESCLRKNALIRQLRTRWFCAVQGSPMSVETFSYPWLAPRAYIFAFEALGNVANNSEAFARRMSNVLRQQGNAHIHGVLLPGKGFFYTKPVHPESSEDDRFHVVYTIEHPLLAFKSILLQGLASFQRPEATWAPALHLYFESQREWREKVPEGGALPIQVADEKL